VPKWKRNANFILFESTGWLPGADEVGTIREANRAAAILLNVSQRFLIGKPLITFISYEERRAFRSKLNQLRQTDWMQGGK